MKYRTLTVVCLAASVLGLGVFAAPSRADVGLPSAGPAVVVTIPANTTVIESVELGGNMRLSRTAAGAVFIAPPQAELSVVQTPVGPSLGLTMPDPSDAPTPGWSVDDAAAVLDRVHGGETFAAIAASFPMVTAAAAPTLDHYEDSACLSGVDKNTYVYTCTNRDDGDVTPSGNKYIGAATFTYGQIEQNARNDYHLSQVVVADHYPIDETIVDFFPQGTVPKSDCATLNAGYSNNGVSIGFSKKVCPKELTVQMQHGGARNGLQTTWHGNEDYSTNSAQWTVAKAPADTGSKMTFSGYLLYSPNCPSGILNSVCRLFGT